MKIKNIIVCILVLLTNLVNVDVDLKHYEKLKINNVASIKPSDLPSEFGEGAFKTVDEFIKKTCFLDFEWVIYFDYITGEILKGVSGMKDNVSLDFDGDKFEGYHIASIHNHPADVYSPPSDKNFGILMRGFEDFELIASVNELWILKAKGVHPVLNMDFKFAAKMFLNSCQEYCDRLYSDNTKSEDMCDLIYGVTLLNYINDKNINDIQLIKKVYNDVN